MPSHRREDAGRERRRIVGHVDGVLRRAAGRVVLVRARRQQVVRLVDHDPVRPAGVLAQLAQRHQQLARRTRGVLPRGTAARHTTVCTSGFSSAVSTSSTAGGLSSVPKTTAALKPHVVAARVEHAALVAAACTGARAARIANSLVSRDSPAHQDRGATAWAAPRRRPPRPGPRQSGAPAACAAASSRGRSRSGRLTTSRMPSPCVLARHAVGRLLEHRDRVGDGDRILGQVEQRVVVLAVAAGHHVARREAELRERDLEARSPCCTPAAAPSPRPC